MSQSENQCDQTVACYFFNKVLILDVWLVAQVSVDWINKLGSTARIYWRQQVCYWINDENRSPAKDGSSAEVDHIKIHLSISSVGTEMNSRSLKNNNGEKRSLCLFQLASLYETWYDLYAKILGNCFNIRRASVRQQKTFQSRMNIQKIIVCLVNQRSAISWYELFEEHASSCNMLSRLLLQPMFLLN